MAATGYEKLKKTILDLATPLVSALGLEIWGLEFVTSGRTVVRLYVDLASDGSNDAELLGASLDQCAEISRQLGLALDVEDVFSDPWVLEVSTPGLDRTFFELNQMSGYEGDVLQAKLTKVHPQGVGGRRVWVGVLSEVLTDSFSLKPCEITPDDHIIQSNDTVINIPWNLTKKVCRKPLFPKPPKPGKGT
ncbi:MAG: ribosome maturation factor RimP [Desulfovibrionaceae bacterium]|nr:ribosome maturation factor RimP [Desulfovibrionaceae bacterium]